jgi:hypothetical protein
MNWLKGLLEPLLDRLALKLANKVRAQLNGAIDSALDRAEERIDTAFEGLEERLLAAATKPIAELKAALEPVITLQQQLQDDVWSKAAEIQQQAIEEAAKAAGMIPAKELEGQIGFAAASARAAAVDHLRSRLTPPRPWKETPDL